MQFKQVNNNRGDVNNAITQKGNVVQSVGDENTVKIEQPKESFWSTLWKKVKGLWKGIFG